MSSELLLRGTALSKTYPTGQSTLATLRQALFGSRPKIGGYEVLTNIDIEVRRGETVGIMGRNGAGKTTLLGILGNVIQQTEGQVDRLGRIATLLGLTAGFNPTFSGKENAFLFCSIQGLSRKQADERIDLIRKFADLGRYFEMPLQSFSSGMQARLAFACAVHVDADLIIIDETLAVGDANFRMKCYDRIRKMRADGQTFLLVSHNQNLVGNFCSRGIVLEGGRKVFDGSTFDAIECYKRVRTESMGDSDVTVRPSGSEAKLLNEDVMLKGFHLLDTSGSDEIVVAAKLVANRDVDQVAVNFGISNQHGIVVCSLNGSSGPGVIGALRTGAGRELRMKFKKRLLPGRYFLSAIVHELIGDVTRPLGLYQNVISFEIGGSDVMTGIADLAMSLELR